jgi:hypothetical protein
MSEYEDPSANTGRFRAFVERGGDEDVAPSRRTASPVVLITAAVMILAIIVVIVAVA